MSSFDPSRLYTTLLNTGLQTRDNPLYQVIHDLINVVVGINKQANISTNIGGSSTVINQQLIQLIGGDDSGGGDDSSGIPGSQGPQGAAGPPGAIGPPGPIFFADDGVDGQDGFNIPVQGAQGAQGITGAQGPAGSILFVEDGIDGQDGFNIPIPGATGAAGATGAPGPVGPVFFVEDGIDGFDGFNIPIPGPAGPAGASGGTGLPRPDTRRVFWISNRPTGNAANSVVGFDAAQVTINTANSTIVMDADSAWAQFQTTATAGASAGLSILAVKYIIVDQLPIYSIKIKTDANITNLRFWFGIISAGFTNSDTLGTTKGIAFRFSTVAADPGWVGVVSDGTTQTVTGNVANIAASTVYTLTIKVTSTTSVSFSVNGGTVVTATIPAGALGTNLTIDQEVFTTENVVKIWRGGLFYLEAN